MTVWRTILISGISALCAFTHPAFAALSSNAPIVDDGSLRVTGQSAGSFIFDFENGFPGNEEVRVDASAGLPYPIRWKFWSQNVGWIVMDHGSAGFEPRLEATPNPTILKITGFAWSENAGWISFAPRGQLDFADPSNSDTYFDKATSRFRWMALSSNLGWIDLSPLYSNLNPPTFEQTVFAADDQKSLVLNRLGVPPIANQVDVFVERWDSPANSLYETADNRVTHDFRKAKPYAYELRDAWWNSSEGTITVVANEPEGRLDWNNIGAGAESTNVSSSVSETRVADGVAYHWYKARLRDKYGNPVVSVPGIKTVRMSAGFSNGVDLDQIDPSAFSPLSPFQTWNGNFGDAIVFGGFWMSSGLMGNTGNETNASNGVFELDVKSFAPTTAWYPSTSADNDIRLTDFSYSVLPENGHVGVGERSGALLGTMVSPLKFSPLVFVPMVENPDNWALRVGFPTSFTTNVRKDGSSAAIPTNVDVATVLDVEWSNSLLAFQDPSPSTRSRCDGFNKTSGVLQSWNYATEGRFPQYCDRGATGSSNSLVRSSALADSDSWTDFWTPGIIVSGSSSTSGRLSTELSYETGPIVVRHPSYGKSIHAPVTSSARYQTVKIVGAASGKNIGSVDDGNAINSFWSTVPISQVRSAIRKNVTEMTRNSGDEGATFKLVKWDASISSWPNWKDTYIVEGGDVYVTADIPNGDIPKTIVAFRDKATGKGWNVFIARTVRSVFATILADGALRSWEPGQQSYPPSRMGTGQLLIKGSVLSSNTIGWASRNPYECPYLVTSECDRETAKSYDLNFLRAYSWTGASSPGYNPEVPDQFASYQTVIIYDSRLQTQPPRAIKSTDVINPN